MLVCPPSLMMANHDFSVKSEVNKECEVPKEKEGDERAKASTRLAKQSRVEGGEDWCHASHNLNFRLLPSLPSRDEGSNVHPGRYLAWLILGSLFQGLSLFTKQCPLRAAICFLLIEFYPTLSTLTFTGGSILKTCLSLAWEAWTHGIKPRSHQIIVPVTFWHRHLPAAKTPTFPYCTIWSPDSVKKSVLNRRAAGFFCSTSPFSPKPLRLPGGSGIILPFKNIECALSTFVLSHPLRLVATEAL
jgi:hypothetical protein